MGEYEPGDSRNVTLNPSNLPGEPPRTGPREGESRAATPEGDNPPKDKVRQENLSQGSGSGDLPDPKRAAGGYDQDEG